MSSNPPQTLANGAEFCHACAQFATGVSVAAVTDASGKAHGITVSSFTSVSLNPPLVLICIGHQASAAVHFRAAAAFGISVLREDQRAVSERFAEPGGDRFEEVPWCPSVTGVPLLPGALAAIECRVVRTLTAGDHDIFIGEVVRTEVRGGRPLIYFGSAYRSLTDSEVRR